MKEIKTVAKESGVSMLKLLISELPFGNAFNEFYFELRGRLQQERLNKFVQSFRGYIEKNGSLNENNILTEKFSDLFESVIRRVVRTPSEEKIKRFRDVLIRQINIPETNTDDAELYLDLITTLSEKEISMLHFHQCFTDEYSNLNSQIDGIKKKRHELEFQLVKEENNKQKGLANNSSSVRDDIRIQENKIASFEVLQESLLQYKTAKFYSIDEGKFLFYKQRLASHGLLIDVGIGLHYDMIAPTPLDLMQVTDFGKEFLTFIVESSQVPSETQEPLETRSAIATASTIFK
jgi:hypothetical protein